MKRPGSPGRTTAMIGPAGSHPSPLSTARSCGICTPANLCTFSSTTLQPKNALAGCLRKVIWLNRGIVGDDTHGHVDDLARFVGPHTVVTVIEKDIADPNHAPLQENLQRLQEMEDLDIVALPMPAPLCYRGQRLPIS